MKPLKVLVCEKCGSELLVFTKGKAKGEVRCVDCGCVGRGKRLVFLPSKKKWVEWEWD